MTPHEGKRAITKLLGKQAAWRDTGKTSSPEQRAERLMAANALKAEYEDIKGRRDALMRRLLDNPEYKALVEATKRTRELMEQARYGSGRYRLTVGLDKGWCFEVKAEGDNWADVVRKLEPANPQESPAS